MSKKFIITGLGKGNYGGSNTQITEDNLLELTEELPSSFPISYIENLSQELAEKVDDSQVLTNVPLNAVFTDTIYTHPTHTAVDTGILSGLNVISRLISNSKGHITQIDTRTIPQSNFYQGWRISDDGVTWDTIADNHSVEFEGINGIVTSYDGTTNKMQISGFNLDKYDYWNLGINDGTYFRVNSKSGFNLAAGTGVTLERTNGVITINSTATGGTADGNNYVSSIGFDTATGSFTLPRSGLTTLSKNIDGRYAILSQANTFTGNITAPKFYQSSLRELKENIKTYEEDALKIINDSEIVRFDRKDGTAKNNIGLIADDSHKDFLSDKQDAVNLYNTIFIQAKAIQQLSNKVTNLEERLLKLEQKLQDG